MSSTISYRPEIDGLRAIAVLPVMIYHAGAEKISGGFVGVDIFFVISGFLITSIIYNEICINNFSFKDFYERRARRIFPALYFITFLSIIPAWIFLIPSDFKDFAENIIGVVTFTSNMVLWEQSDYFSQAAELKPLLHTWSLAVEEQYYVLFPILLILLYKYLRKYTLLIILIIMLTSLLVSQWAAFSKPTANYYLLPTRAWELLIGSIAALLYTNENLKKHLEINHKYSNILSLVGFASISISFFIFNSQTPFPSLWTLIPILGTLLLILFTTPETVSYKILSNKILIGIGLISYSAYLWHQPLYAFTRQQSIIPANDLVMTFAFFMSIFLAYLTWRYIEKPFRNKNIIQSYHIWWFSIIFGSILIVFSIYSLKNDGFSNRFVLKEPLTEKNFDLPKISNGWCFYSVDSNLSLEIGQNGINCILGEPQSELKALLFGDSYAGMYEPFWHTLGKELSISINSITTNWCHTSFSDNFWWNKETRAVDQCMFNREYLLNTIDNYDIVILSSVWSTLETHGLIGEVNSFIEDLTISRNLRVIIMAQPHSLERSSVLRAIYNDGNLIEGNNENAIQRINKHFYEMATKNDNLFFIDRDSLFKAYGNTNKFALDEHGIPYSLDGGHISIYGSERAAINFINSTMHPKLNKFINGN